MAPKKKPAGQGGEEDKFEEFMKVFQKKQKEFDIPKSPLPEAVQDAITKMELDGEEQLAWKFTREFDLMSFRILFHSLRISAYDKIEAIWVWKCNGGDESVRSVCYYLNSPDPVPQVKDVHFTDNGVTALGCEFLGRTLGPTGNPVVNVLRLDNNKFGAEGVEKLSMGLSQNSTLRQLSLNYCDIGPEGGQYLGHILMFVRCGIEKLELRGNYLGDDGIVEVFHGCRRTKSLQDIDVFDNKFTDTPDVIDALRFLFMNNTSIKNYNLGGNQISDQGAHKLVTGMIGQTHLQAVFVTERCSMKTFEAIEEITSAKKKKKGKKK